PITLRLGQVRSCGQAGRDDHAPRERHGVRTGVDLRRGLLGAPRAVRIEERRGRGQSRHPATGEVSAVRGCHPCPRRVGAAVGRCPKRAASYYRRGGWSCMNVQRTPESEQGVRWGLVAAVTVVVLIVTGAPYALARFVDETFGDWQAL